MFCQILSRDILVSPLRLISTVTPVQEPGPGYLDRVRSNKFRAFTGDKVNKRVVCTKPTRPMMNCPVSALPHEFRFNTGLRLFATAMWQNNHETYRS